MPAVATITINNGEATPIAHNFAPLGQDPKTGFWWFEDQVPRVATTNVLGFPRIGIRTKRGAQVTPGDAAKDSVQRVEITIACPQLETVGTGASGYTPSATIAYVDRYMGTYILPSRDVLADRRDILAYGQNIMGNANVIDLVRNLTSLF